jgi:hypothetical protein
MTVVGTIDRALLRQGLRHDFNHLFTIKLALSGWYGDCAMACSGGMQCSPSHQFIEVAIFAAGTLHAAGPEG